MEHCCTSMQRLSLLTRSARAQNLAGLARSRRRPRDSVEDSRTASRCLKHTAKRRKVHCRAEYNGAPQPGNGLSTSMLDLRYARHLGLNPQLVGQLADLPGTAGLEGLKARAQALAGWRNTLQKGTVPPPGEYEWPVEPFQSKFKDAMIKLEMPRFCRRYPKLTDVLLQQMLALVQEFEEQLQELEQEQEERKQAEEREQQQSSEGEQQAQQAGSGAGESSGDPQEQPQDGDAEGDAEGEMSQEQIEEMMQQSRANAEGKGTEVEMEMQTSESSPAPQGEPDAKYREKLKQALAEKAEDLVNKFQEEWKETMQNMAEAEDAFEDLEDLIDGGTKGFDMHEGMWRNSGWQVLGKLRRKLEQMRELRDLVRSLGRSGGKGPKRLAPQRVGPRGAEGVIRSELQPEETSGLARSGDISRMLPMEAHLLAQGWAARAAMAAAVTKEEQEAAAVKGRMGQAAKRLFMAKRAERMLASYQREGWLEDQPSRATGRNEIRPAAEMGPIIVCLDTSYSMAGKRETVAKAVALECMRGAHRQGRDCYLYAFSGPQQCQELVLDHSPGSMSALLNFLSFSFLGGTDVDTPFLRALDRLTDAAWRLSDILLVTDGEIPRAKDDVKNRLAAARDELELKVHCLLVGEDPTGQSANHPLLELVDKLHVFTSWSSA